MWDLSNITDLDEKQTEEEKYKQSSRARKALYVSDLAYDRRLKPGDRDIRAAHTGNTLNVGLGSWVVDTGVAITPHESAFLAGAGDQIGDVWRGIAQIMKERGIADLIDIEAQDQAEDIMRQLYDDKALGTAAMWGGGVGMFAEPAGLLMPMMKAKKLSTAIIGMAAIGAVYGASLYIDHDESRLTNAAISASMMGVLGAGFHKYFAHAVGGDIAKIIDDAVEQEAEVVARVIPGTKDKPYSYKDFDISTKEGRRKTRKGSALGDEPRTTKKPKKVKKPRKSKTEVQNDTMESLEVKASFEGRRQGLLSKLWGTVKKAGEEPATIFNRAMQPI